MSARAAACCSVTGLSDVVVTLAGLSDAVVMVLLSGEGVEGLKDMETRS